MTPMTPDAVTATSARSPSEHHEPYIAATTTIRELTVRSVLVGTLLGVVFGASSLYLVLKVGLTVSASIPVAVISITLFRLLAKAGLARDATILENNIVQTAGSAGESIAFGVGVTMPAIMILGFDLEITRVMLVATLGGLLGILMMIPLRRALIVEQHSTLKYPEGTACAEVLKAGASSESRQAMSEAARREEAAAGSASMSAHTIFAGFGIGLIYKSVMVAFKGWKDVPEKVFGPPLAGGSVAAEISPELLGVGYIIGPRIASVMCAGGVLAYLVLIPLIKFFGAGIPGALAPGAVPIAEMSPGQIRGAYVLYIGAGAVAAGGVISLVRSLPTIWRGLREGLRDFRGGSRAAARRTERDLPMKLVVIGGLAIIGVVWLSPSLHMNLLGALLVIVFGFLFVTVSSRLAGEIGTSSNPISGMTVATLLLTCVIFLAIGWTGPGYYVTALSVGAIVCVAAANGGATSQDLKSGFLVGATPRSQQISILVGALASALVLGPILLSLNASATVYVPAAKVAPGLMTDPAPLTHHEKLEGPQGEADTKTYRVWQKLDTQGGPAGKYLVDDAGHVTWLVDPGINGAYTERPDGSTVRKFDAPKATLMSYIIKGILDRQLPWGLVLFGVMIAVVLELSGVPSLAFAVGVYLPISSSTPILCGGIVRWWVDRRRADSMRARGISLNEAQLAADSDRSPGVLMASGYIAGGAIAGIVIAFLAGFATKFDASMNSWSAAHNPLFGGELADGLALIPFVAIVLVLLFAGLPQRESRGGAPPS
ncbi:MAG TPA: oligopeptide transporter, OPT family [Polyangiaceae bacterium]|nr:oligopeptide transporter, OPT family [Polyangiaceae bacterium]